MHFHLPVFLDHRSQELPLNNLLSKLIRKLSTNNDPLVTVGLFRWKYFMFIILNPANTWYILGLISYNKT